MNENLILSKSKVQHLPHFYKLEDIDSFKEEIIQKEKILEEKSKEATLFRDQYENMVKESPASIEFSQE